MIVCYQCQGSKIILNPGGVPSSTTGISGNWVDGDQALGKWPPNTTPMKCPACLGNGYQTNFGATLY